MPVSKPLLPPARGRGSGPISQCGHWRHQTVHAQFVEQLINRRHRYPPTLRTVLSETMLLRQEADYETDSITQKQATRALRRSREFVEAIRLEGGGSL